MKIKFTILTVVKNDKKGIIKTIKSVLSQSFTNFEYIIIDGNSSDGTSYEINKIKLPKKFKIITRNDISYYDSLNYGISISNGKYIGVLNSGDIFKNKDILKKINNSLIKNTHIFYNNLIFRKNRNIVRYWRHNISKITKYNLFKIPHSTLFLTKNVYKKVGLYNLNYKISSDLDFIIRLSNKYTKIKHLDFDSIYMEYGGLSTNIKTLKLKLREDLNILINHYRIYFIFFYFLKIFFKINDFKLKNLIKTRS